MKKIFLPLLITVIALSLSAQIQSGYVPFHQFLLSNRGDIQKQQGNARNVVFEEIAYMHYSPVNDSNWIYADSGQFFFNQSITGTSLVYETAGNYFQYVGVKWDSASMFTNTADSLGLILTSVGQNFDTATHSWVNSYQYLNTYNSINYLASQELDNWTGSWTAASKSNTTYGATNFDSVVVIQTGSALQNDTQYLYTYNGYNNTELLTQIWSGSAWTNLYKQSNSFDANGNNYQSFVSVWNGTGWSNYALIIRGYDLNNELVSYLYELWNASSGAYVNSYQEAYAWVLSNNTRFENYNWDTTSNTWTPLSLNTYNYDGNHNVIYEFDQSYVNGAFANAAQYYYYYQGYQVSGIKALNGDLKANLFPNPCNGIATISFSAGKAGDFVWSVYDEQGNLLQQQHINSTPGLNQLQVNLTGYAAGNYLVQLVDAAGGKSGVLQLVKQ